MSYLENGPLYNRLLCGCDISELVGCDRLGELYHKVGLEIGDVVASTHYSVIYENRLRGLGMIWCSFIMIMVMMLLLWLDWQIVFFLWLKDGPYSAILDIGKFLHYKKVNYCCKYMKWYRSVFDHVCLLPVTCIKCYCIHDDKSGGRSAKCPLRDVIFYSEVCLRNHFSHMLTIWDEEGEH